MKLIIIYIITFSLIGFSCTSSKSLDSGKYLSTSTYVNNLTEFEKVDTIAWKNFSVYRHCLCNKLDDSYNETNVFEICSDDFYKKVNDDKNTLKQKKMDEVYLMIDETSQLVIYFTTIYHKILFNRSGIFNDIEYDTNIFITDIDKIFVGKLENNKIKFEWNGSEHNKDMIWYLKKDDKNIEINTINVATAENRYQQQDINVKKALKTPLIFKKYENQPFLKYANTYNLKKNKQIKKYINNPNKTINSIYLISRKDGNDLKNEIVFDLEEIVDNNKKFTLYRVGSFNIPYKFP